MNPGDLLSDKMLTVILLSLTLVNVVVCTLWVTVGKPVRTEISRKVDFERRVEIVQDVCRTRYFFVWFSSTTAYHFLLLLTATFLSMRAAPKYQKQFRRNEVILLTYIVIVTFAIGYPVYYLAQYITKNLELEYVVANAVWFCIVISYLVLFFASPLIQAIREKGYCNNCGVE